MYLCGFTISYINLSETCKEYCVSGVDQFSAELLDTHERQLSALGGSGDQAFGYCHTLRSSLPPVWKHGSRDDVHRQDVLRPEGHHAGGRLGGL